MTQLIEDAFFKGPQPISKPLFASQHLTNRVVNLERGVNYFYAAEGLNPNDENSSLLHYIQVHLGLMECAWNERLELGGYSSYVHRPVETLPIDLQVFFCTYGYSFLNGKEACSMHY